MTNGEKLVKARNQRHIGTTILIPANETVVIPASFLKNIQLPHNINGIGSRGHAKASLDYLDQFARVDSQIGALFVINGKVAGMDCFGKPEVLEKIFMKMIEGYAQDAADNFDPSMKLRSSKAEAINFLQTEPFWLVRIVKTSMGVTISQLFKRLPKTS